MKVERPPANGNPGIVPPWLQQFPIPISPDPDIPVIMQDESPVDREAALLALRALSVRDG